MDNTEIYNLNKQQIKIAKLSVNLFRANFFARKNSVQRLGQSPFYTIGKDDFPIV